MAVAVGGSRSRVLPLCGCRERARGAVPLRGPLGAAWRCPGGALGLRGRFGSRGTCGEGAALGARPAAPGCPGAIVCLLLLLSPPSPPPFAAPVVVAGR